MFLIGIDDKRLFGGAVPLIADVEEAVGSVQTLAALCQGGNIDIYNTKCVHSTRQTQYHDSQIL